MKKCDCWNCAYCGEFDKNGHPMCRWEGAPGEKLPHPYLPLRAYTLIEEIPLEGECGGYIPTLEEEELDIEIVSYSDISFKCPFCGASDSVQAEPLHCDTIVECYQCDKKFRIYFDNY